MSTVVTSCGILVLATSGHILLGHATGSRRWDIFKGLQEPGESERDTALRELQEESGLVPAATDLLDLGKFEYLPRKNLHLFALLTDRFPTSTLRCSSTFIDRSGRSRLELDAFEWISFEQVPDRCGTSLIRVLTSKISLPEVARMREEPDQSTGASVLAAAPPARIQLSRTKGWRMPPNTVNVARPGRWGNPFPIGKPGPSGAVAADQASSVSLFTAMLRDDFQRVSAAYPCDLSPLRGKNLACWCRPGTPCHGDLLLKLANSTPLDPYSIDGSLS